MLQFEGKIEDEVKENILLIDLSIEHLETCSTSTERTL